MSANSKNFGLRLITPADEEEVHQLLCVPEVYEYLADGVEPPRFVTREWIAASADDNNRFGGGLWGLHDCEQDAVAGLVRLSDFSDSEVQLTYLLHPRYWKRLLAVRMSHTAMHHAISRGVASTIWAGADVPNSGSVAVLKRLGMRFRRDVEYPAGPGVEYAISAGEFDEARFERLPMC